MILDINQDEIFENPDAQTVRKAIAELDVEDFAILSKSDQIYIQTLLDEDANFIVEYRNGSADKHFAAEGENITRLEVEKAFLSYLSGGNLWLDQWMWEQVEFEEE